MQHARGLTGTSCHIAHARVTNLGTKNPLPSVHVSKRLASTPCRKPQLNLPPMLSFDAFNGLMNFRNLEHAVVTLFRRHSL